LPDKGLRYQRARSRAAYRTLGHAAVLSKFVYQFSEKFRTIQITNNRSARH
jgi:hypothetical protein